VLYGVKLLDNRLATRLNGSPDTDIGLPGNRVLSARRGFPDQFGVCVDYLSRFYLAVFHVSERAQRSGDSVILCIGCEAALEQQVAALVEEPDVVAGNVGGDHAAI
jgi:hypothetical protein